MSNSRERTGYAKEVRVMGNDKVKKAIDALSKHGLITFSREADFKSSKYTIHFFKPTEELKNLYNLGNEVLIVCCSDGMRDFKSRTKDYIDYILTTKEEFKNRLDKIACFLIDENPNIVEIVENDRNTNPDSRLIVPFSISELQDGVTEDGFNDRLRSVLYVRDLFGIASPLNNEAFYFGKDRATLITDLYGKYQQGEPGGLFGLRRIGKTSALYLLRNRINQNGGAAVYFDCTRYHHGYWNGLLKNIIKKVVEEFSYDANNDYGISLPKDFNINTEKEGRYSKENAINSFEEDIKTIHHALGNTRVHLIFDEIESISYNTSPSEQWRNGKDAVSFWEAIRSVLQMNNEYFSYLIAGVNPMCVEISVIDGIPNPIFGGFSPIYMKLFDEQDVMYMVSAIGGHLGLNFETQVCSKLVEDYGGHPFLTRQVCSRINKYFLDVSKPRPLTVSRYDYEKMADDYRLAMTQVIEQILGVLEEHYPSEYELLKELAINGRDSFKKRDAVFGEGIQHLLGYCLIEKSCGEYFIRIKSIEKYLQEKFINDKQLNTQNEKRARINLRRDAIEEHLRNMIWHVTFQKFGNKKAYSRIVDIVRGTSADKGQETRLKNAHGKEVMNELYLDQLRIIIEKDYKDYQAIFSDRKEFQTKFSILIDSRKVGAHTKPVSDEEEALFGYAFKYFEECLEDW